MSDYICPGRFKPGDRVRVTFETTIIRPVGGKDDDLLYVRNPAGDLPAIVHEDWLTLLVEPERDHADGSPR